jgi:3',5'-cyclic AMP phosphodiesterase CpdA
MTKAFTLFHASDLHFGAQDSAALAWFAARVAQEQPAGIIITGDLTMRGTAREFDAAARWLAQLPAPLWVEPGNHDIPYYWELLHRLRRPFARFSAMHGRLNAVAGAQGDGFAVVSLRTVAAAQWRLNWANGCVRRPALAHTVAGLHAAPKGLRLVACHHPLVGADPARPSHTRGGEKALAALAGAGADAVLSGHVHDPFVREVQEGGRAMLMIGAGTLSERLRKTPPGFNRLVWSAQHGLQVTPEVMA